MRSEIGGENTWRPGGKILRRVCNATKWHGQVLVLVWGCCDCCGDACLVGCPGGVVDMSDFFNGSPEDGEPVTRGVNGLVPDRKCRVHDRSFWFGAVWGFSMGMAGWFLFYLWYVA